MINSHYCRAKTSKQYLDPSLNISKMYDLCKEKCLEINEEPVKESYYRFIFNTAYNIGFHKPKTDRCDFCELYKVKNDNKIELTPEDVSAQQEHLAEKLAMREEKGRDKEEEDILIVVFDLQNVVTLPKAEISSFFYKRKLTVLNYVKRKVTVQCGLSNDIASAFIAMIERIVKDYPRYADIVVWSDSCVPQSRNSYIAHAVIEFMTGHPHIASTTMEYSIRGHGCVQEVDNMHKKIGDAMKVREFYSPFSFLRVLLQVDRKNPYTDIQMQESRFKYYKFVQKC